MSFDRKVPGKHVTRQSVTSKKSGSRIDSSIPSEIRQHPRLSELRMEYNASLTTRKCNAQQPTYVYVGEGLCVRDRKFYVVQQTYNLGRHYRTVISAVICLIRAND